ncbi:MULTISPECIES: TetR/AcrR family transcriptional regulator [Kordiimonas]|jgi:AcrR family transcriptional regulator|uniref:Transcriptional regulator, TetR family n=1 Tax=Kordiimonas lacus TaxID=637679 RepID=A0A1G6SXU9_9PROT|nr:MULTISPECIES: TetR/AcrR family transcriptional regulator [Kordiimonas]SDD21780.1 transcriptional regulator, TetR family [Kordiimonas lacus]
MAGLREKQKAQRRALIEKAAADLFVEKGFADTTIEEIAERALVSAPTVYNYYGTKGDLLLALVARGEEGIEEAQDDFSKQTGTHTPSELVAKVIHSNVNDTLSALSRELWGHVVAFVATASDPAVAPRYIETIASGLGTAIESVLRKYQDDGKLRAGTDMHELAFLLTRMERIHFLNYVYLKDMTVEDLHNAIAADVAMIVGPYEI